MGESDEQRTQEESAEVEGHLAGPEGNRIARQEDSPGNRIARQEDSPGNRIARQEGSDEPGDFEGHMKNHHMKNRPAKKT